MTFSHSNNIHGTNLATESDFIDLKPLSDKNQQGQFPATLSTFSLEKMIRDSSGLPSPGLLTFTPWYGGQPLQSFIRGTACFDNLMISARKAVDVANQYNREVECKFYTFIQGESGGDDYENTLKIYANDVTNELATQIGQQTIPYFVMLQINSSDIAMVENGIEQAQLNSAMDESNNIVLAGPMYDAPVGDSIHQTPIGRMIVGEKIAACHHSLLNEGAFTPLCPVDISVVDKFVDITFSVPGNGLKIDNDWMPAVPNYGFSYEDDSDSAEIVNVSIKNPTTVRIELSDFPTGGSRKIKYAVLTETQEDGWANGRGQLYSPTDIESFFHSQGYEVPEFIRHYSVRFTKGF